MLSLDEIEEVQEKIRELARDIKELTERGSSDDFKDRFIEELSVICEVGDKIREVGLGVD